MALPPPPTGLAEGPGYLSNVSLLSPTQGPYSGQNQLRRQCLLFLKAAAKPETPFSLRTGGVDMQSGLWTTLNSGVCLYP